VEDGWKLMESKVVVELFSDKQAAKINMEEKYKSQNGFR
jgi:hypothetical protein